MKSKIKILKGSTIRTPGFTVTLLRNVIRPLVGYGDNSILIQYDNAVCRLTDPRWPTVDIVTNAAEANLEKGVDESWARGTAG